MNPLFRERLRPDHDLTAFSSGDATLDHWLHRSALTADRAGTARTYVWVDEFGAVRAYFSLVPHVVRRADLPAKLGRGSPDLIPAVLLARLALAEKLHGQPERWGTVLLLDALHVAVTAIRRVGGRLIVVDAIDDKAKSFYEHHDFKPVSSDPYRLVLKASDVARALDVPWP